MNSYKERLPQNIERILEDIGRVADKMGMTSYIVGGIVRDILLGYKNLDLDIVIEGDGLAFAQEFAQLYKAKVRVYQRFGTAAIEFPDGFKLDIATARTEYYAYPTALPTVKSSSIKNDLYRRDFTINTLAIRLNQKDYGSLIDFYGGERDIREKTIRVLHNLSFIEDPTRVFRAIRFEQRFNFRIEKHTQDLIKGAVKMEIFHRLSGHRLYDELLLIFSEREPVKSLRRMAEFDLLRFIHPGLKVRDIEPFFRKIQGAIEWYNLLFLDEEIETWQIYLMGILDGLGRESSLELFHRLSLPDSIAYRFINAIEAIRNTLLGLSSQPGMKASEIYTLLHPLSIEAILLIMAKAKKGHIKRYISLYLTTLKKVRISTTGRDLIRMGIKRGPIYREIFEDVLKAILDERIKTKEEELEYIRKSFSPHS